MKKLVFLTVLLLICAIALIACGGVQTTKPYAVTKATAEEILYDARILQSQGIITDADFELVRAIYEKIRAAQDVAIDARIALIKVNSAENQNKVSVAVAEVDKLTSELVSLAGRLGIKRGGAK